jgi:hypothetical protein
MACHRYADSYRTSWAVQPYLATLQSDWQKAGIDNPGLMFVGNHADEIAQPDRIGGSKTEKGACTLRAAPHWTPEGVVHREV